MSLWFVFFDGKVTGPYTIAQMSALAATGRILPNHLVAPSGSSRWRRADEVESIFGERRAVPDHTAIDPAALEATMRANAEAEKHRRGLTRGLVSIVLGFGLLQTSVGLAASFAFSDVGRPGLEWLFQLFVAGIVAGIITMLVGVGLLAAYWVERLALSKSQ